MGSFSACSREHSEAPALRREVPVKALMYADLDRLKRLETLAVSTVVLDRKGKIVGVNDVWKSFGKRNGLRLPNFGIGANYLSYCGPEQETAALAQDPSRSHGRTPRYGVDDLSVSLANQAALVLFDCLPALARGHLQRHHSARQSDEADPLPDVFASSPKELGSKHPFNRMRERSRRRSRRASASS